MNSASPRPCRVCSTPLSPFMSFGQMPIANGFLPPEDIGSEYFFEMAPAVCTLCGMFQLMEQPDAERMFHGEYAFFSSTSRHMQVHFQQFAEHAMRRACEGRPDPFVVELGSNDGIMLRHFKNAGIRHLGIEPSSNVADVARAQGINTISKFFNTDLAEWIVAEHGQASAILSANVMCHIPDINSVAAGIARLLAPDGMLMFEDPYLGDMIAKTSYDQIYDEHVFMFSATSVAWAFGQHGLELIDLLPQTTHGGSMRYVLAPKGSRPVAESVARVFAAEAGWGVRDAATYDRFRANCEASRDALRELLFRLQREGRKVAGYAATSKSTTVLNYCGLGPDQLAFISDTTPIKQGKVSPGAHVPVKAYEHFVAEKPEYAVLFAWNHAAEIFEKEQGFKERGGRWITFVPSVGVIE